MTKPLDELREMVDSHAAYPDPVVDTTKTYRCGHKTDQFSGIASIGPLSMDIVCPACAEMEVER
jgi:hypothetical protein